MIMTAEANMKYVFVAGVITMVGSMIAPRSA
jgi:hypothetical protein